MQKTEIADNQQGNTAYLIGVFLGDGCYLKKKDIERYRAIIKELNLRK